MSRVAIIGGGISGISALDAMVDEGLQPVLFEARSSVGGIWGKDPSFTTYRSLRANTSKYSYRFSKKLHPDTTDMHPTKEQMGHYLEDFVAANNLEQYIRFSHKVRSVVENEHGTWSVDGEEFDKLVVASGEYCTEKMSDEIGHVLDVYEGEHLPFSSYRGPEQMAAKSVLVIGCSFSGAEVASELATHRQTTGDPTPVSVLMRSPSWFCERLTQGNGLSWELMFNRRDYETPLNSADLFSFMKSLCVPAHDQLWLAPPGQSPSLRQVRLVIADGFCDHLYGGRITMHRGTVRSVDVKQITFTDRESAEFDVIVTALGFRPNLSFLPDKLLAAIKYNTDYDCASTSLYKYTWPNPELVRPNVAFVGMVAAYTSWTLLTEIQAMWVAGVFSGRVPYNVTAEGYAEYDATISERKKARFQFTLQTVPVPELPSLVDGMARECGAFPMELMEGSDVDDPVYRAVRYGPMTNDAFRLEGPHGDRELACKHIMKMIELYESHGLDVANPITCTSESQHHLR